MKYQKLSKAAKRAIEGGAIPPVRGKVKHYQPKRRFNCRRGERDWSTNQHGSAEVIYNPQYDSKKS